MPIMPSGDFEPIGGLRQKAIGLRNMLVVAADLDRLSHPAAVAWQRELTEIETAIEEYNAGIAEKQNHTAAA